jgi:hypothetical protein
VVKLKKKKSEKKLSEHRTVLFTPEQDKAVSTAANDSGLTECSYIRNVVVKHVKGLGYLK